MDDAGGFSYGTTRLIRKHRGNFAGGKQVELPAEVGPQFAKDDVPVGIDVVLCKNLPQIPVAAAALAQRAHHFALEVAPVVDLGVDQ